MSEEAPAPAYHLVIVRQAEGVVCEALADFQALAARLKELQGPGVTTFQFRGSRIHTSKGPLRWLLGDEKAVPLFNAYPELSPDDSGSLSSVCDSEDGEYIALSKQGLAAAKPPVKKEAEEEPEEKPVFELPVEED
jgi:hypothetical protein